MTVLVAASLVAVPSADALEPGVSIDPGSPAGKEYALPLDRARRDAAGGSSRTRGRGHSPAGSQDAGNAAPGLFGQGITPPGSGGTGGPTGGSPAGTPATSAGHRAARAHAGARAGRSKGGPAGARVPSAGEIRAAADIGQGSAFSSPIGLALFVLIAGAALGIAARRLGGSGRRTA